MTNDEINAQVAEHVMGWERLSCHSGNCFYRIKIINGKEKAFEGLVPDYCTSWEAMGQVVEKMGTYWMIEYTKTGWVVIYHPKFEKVFHSKDNLAPKAVALAALKAVGRTDDIK